jgi:hypothetical protein
MAIETTKKWCEAEVHRMPGEIPLKSPQPDAANACAHFERRSRVRFCGAGKGRETARGDKDEHEVSPCARDS